MRFAGSFGAMSVVRLMSWSTLSWHYIVRLCICGMLYAAVGEMVRSRLPPMLFVGDIVGLFPALLMTLVPASVDAFLRLLMFGAWFCCIVLEGFACCELLVDFSHRLVRRNIDQLAFTERQRRVQLFFMLGMLLAYGVAFYFAGSFIVSGHEWWNWQQPQFDFLAALTSIPSSSSTSATSLYAAVETIPPTLLHVIVLGFVLLLIVALSIALIWTERAPLTDTALLAVYCVAAYLVSYRSLSNAPMRCSAQLDIAYYYWSWTGQLPSSNDYFYLLGQPLFTAGILLSLIYSRSRINNNDNDNNSTTTTTSSSSSDGISVGTLMTITMLVIVGGEVVNVCSATSSLATLWRGATLCIAAILYYWWRIFGGGRSDDDDDDD